MFVPTASLSPHHLCSVSLRALAKWAEHLHKSGACCICVGDTDRAIYNSRRISTKAL